MLQTGSAYRYAFTLGDTPLGPHNYLAIPSAVSSIPLSNGGSGVRLMDPSGAIAFEVPSYGVAKEGQSWMLDESGWHWSLTPTPGAANVLTLPAPKPAAATTSSATAKTVKKTTAPAAAKTPKKTDVPKIPSSTKAAQTTGQNTLTNTAAANPPTLWLLIPIGAIIIGYAVFEYRQEIGRLSSNCWTAMAKILGAGKTPAPEPED